jgi:hypothetical protein
MRHVLGVVSAMALVAGCGGMDNFFGHDKNGKRIYVDGTDQIEQAIHCTGWDAMGNCNYWAPDASGIPVGYHMQDGTFTSWYSCQYDPNVYINEVVIWPRTNFQGPDCFYMTTHGPGGNYTTYVSPLGDMDRYSPQSIHVRSILGRVWRYTVYDGPSLMGNTANGTAILFTGGGEGAFGSSNVGIFDTSSMFIEN